MVGLSSYLRPPRLRPWLVQSCFSSVIWSLLFAAGPSEDQLGAHPPWFFVLHFDWLWQLCVCFPSSVTHTLTGRTCTPMSTTNVCASLFFQ